MQHPGPLGGEMSRVTSSKSDNIEAPGNSASLPSPSDFILNTTLKRYTFLVCVWYVLNEIGMQDVILL